MYQGWGRGNVILDMSAFFTRYYFLIKSREKKSGNVKIKLDFVIELDIATYRIKRLLLQVSSHSLSNLQVTTKRNDWRVTDHADRLALPQTFLDFCGSFPIYIIEKTSVDAEKSSFQNG